MELDNTGVSPVIGTILLIAITVVIAGTVGYFAMTESPGQTAPTVAMSVEQDAGSYTLYHNGGDNLSIADLNILVAGENVEENLTGVTSFSVGESLNLSDAYDVGAITSGNRIAVVHEPSNSLLLDTEA